jgi:hypothetical protein
MIRRRHRQPMPLPDAPAPPRPLRYVDPGYAPVLDRLSTERRVLAHVTAEVDQTYLGPQNTVRAITFALLRDPHTSIDAMEQIQPNLHLLVEQGSPERRRGASTPSRTRAGANS